jgi:hypothetical protein
MERILFKNLSTDLHDPQHALNQSVRFLEEHMIEGENYAVPIVADRVEVPTNTRVRLLPNEGWAVFQGNEILGQAQRSKGALRTLLFLESLDIVIGWELHEESPRQKGFYQGQKMGKEQASRPLPAVIGEAEIFARAHHQYTGESLRDYQQGMVDGFTNIVVSQRMRREKNDPTSREA